MKPLRVFISSVQSEFSEERKALTDYLRNDPLMRRGFQGFLFEELPALDRRPDNAYLDEVERCDIYIGLFGKEYGSEDGSGTSPTEREFDHATALGKYRLIFLKNAPAGVRHSKMQALIGKAEAGLIRKRFNTQEELMTGLYAALVEYLEDKELLRFGPFDAAPCEGATLDDLDSARMSRLIRTARRTRQFPLDEDTPAEDLLRHLNLLHKGGLTNAAMLLFGKAPQRFLISSEIKCAHFHGTQVAKPIPSYQVYKGTVFDLVDQAVDFVLSKIALSVGTRAESVEVPIAYEIPKEVITEAIVNAVAHRDYTDNSSVQVMLFADRLDVMNTGRLPPPLTVEKLRVAHESLPRNPLLAEPMYLAGYIERMGTGTVDMIQRCAAANLREPEFAASEGFVTTIWRPNDATRPAGVHDADKTGVQIEPESRPESGSQPESRPESQPESEPQPESRLLTERVLGLLINGSMSKAKLSKNLGQKEVSGQLNKVVRSLMSEQLIEYTLPENPRSRLQQYRLTPKGRAAIENLGTDGT
ncbi:MAG: DUF4062 domain-containing protein [Gammaproteobacteria bacterium]|nr:DUF4062 domain-containing protein [Gammaproteobacteria bacterium]MXY89432.1 DUF4062 domain-containing protein [Gammaproteobacteria bacterium]MYA67888.1 DUF4062 domain-containing protein [Gammaproteobacteria bacterium]MYE28703.1 DUF4062 domain-containing protein [Gammaproteobacteria bacterium]MYG97628.1 DUF4062 domain-containing protein [Gammaproteobacteria bacterium]